MSYCIFLQYRAALPYWEPVSMRSLGLTHWSTTLQTFNRHTQPRVTATSGEEQVCLEVNPRWATSNTDVESNLTLTLTLCPLNGTIPLSISHYTRNISRTTDHPETALSRSPSDRRVSIRIIELSRSTHTDHIMNTH